MTKRLIHQQNMIILNTYVPKNEASKYDAKTDRTECGNREFSI